MPGFKLYIERGGEGRETGFIIKQSKQQAFYACFVIRVLLSRANCILYSCFLSNPY